MSDFSERVAAVLGVAPSNVAPLVPDSLSEVLLVTWPDGRRSVAKHSSAAGVEASMLRALLAADAPAPAVEAEHQAQNVLVLEYVANDGLFDASAWASLGTRLRFLHTPSAEDYGWPDDFAIGCVDLGNGRTRDWPAFWAEGRLVATARGLDRPWRERVDRVAARIRDWLPAAPPAALLHGDLWTGNMLVHGGRLVGLVDPACCFGDAEADLAMLALFSSPPEQFGEAYGALHPGWRERRPVYQLFPALLHARLWGERRFSMVDRVLGEIGF